MNKAPNSKSQAHAAHPNSHEFQKGLLMAVGYGPYTARGEMCWIATAYIVVQLQIFSQGEIVLCPVELIGADLLKIYTLNFISLSTTKPWILLMFPNEISKSHRNRSSPHLETSYFPLHVITPTISPIPLPPLSLVSYVSCTVSRSNTLHSFTHLSCSITCIVSFHIAYSLFSPM